MTAAAGRSIASDAQSILTKARMVASGGEPVFAADPMAGFQSTGEFASAILREGGNTGLHARDERLRFLAAAPGTFGSELSGVDGGFAVPADIAKGIWTYAQAESSLLPWCTTVPVDSNTLLLPADRNAPWGTAGVRASWQAEGVALTQTKPNLGSAEMRLLKLLAFVPVSDELLNDSPYMGAYLPVAAGTSIRWKTNDAILNGLGNGTPQGCFTSAAALTVAKESGQSASTIVLANLSKLVGTLTPGSLSNAIWLVTHDAINALIGAAPAGYPMCPPGPQFPGALGLLYGRPVYESQHAAAFSSAGDVMLADLSYYIAITKPTPIDQALSLHVMFDADAAAFRFTFRMDGQPIITAPLTQAVSSNKLSPFVRLAAR